MLPFAFSLPSILWRLRSPAELTFIVVFLVALAVALTFREKLRKYRTRNWPTAQGTISNLKSRRVDGGANGIDYWKITFDYTYIVQQSHTGSYKFNCTSETMAAGATAGLAVSTVCVHVNPANEAKSFLWEDEIWDLWWDTYWNIKNSPEVTGA